jgi:glutaredoxin-related protein
MPRSILSPDNLHPSIRQNVSDHHREIVEEVLGAVERDAIVVVGMAQNPHCRAARRHLTAEGQTFTYLEYGSYLSQWRARTALKMWTGWATLPIVFVRGMLVGGASDLKQLIDSGELKTLLSAA